MNQSTHATSFSRRIDVSTLLGSSTLGCHRTSTESYQQKAIDYNLSLLTIGYGCFIYSTLRISIVYRSIDYCSFKTYFEIPSFEKPPSGNRVGVICRSALGNYFLSLREEKSIIGGDSPY